MNECIVFQQEHEENVSMVKNDSISFLQALGDPKSEKWIEALNEEYKSM